MSLTLGEKLQSAREERGLSISEVSEQTRISSLYLQAIENNDYKPLPGGIFNKGFVKSYAKFIGVDEQEALQDYARIAAENEIVAEHELKVYRPEVLTDDSSSISLLPTVLFAGIILALMTGGILFLVNYFQNENGDADIGNANATQNTNIQLPGNVTETQAQPVMGSAIVEFRAIGESISLTSVTDGNTRTQTLAAGAAVTFEPKQSLILSYSRSLASAARLSINGKSIVLPATPQNPRRNVIEIEISDANLAEIWRTGTIGSGKSPVGTTIESTPNPVSTVQSSPSAANSPPATPRPSPPATPRPKPSPARTPTPRLSNTVIPVRPTPNLD